MRIKQTPLQIFKAAEPTETKMDHNNRGRGVGKQRRRGGGRGRATDSIFWENWFTWDLRECDKEHVERVINESISTRKMEEQKEQEQKAVGSGQWAVGSRQ